MLPEGSGRFAEPFLKESDSTMQSLQYSGRSGVVEWIGRVGDRDASLKSSAAAAARLSFAGLEGEAHSGLTRPSDVRVEDLYPLDTAIRNTRQLSILSAEDIEAIASDMGLAALKPEFLGANLVIRGLPWFTLVPPASRLQFAGGATVTVDMENLPCNHPAREIETVHPGHGRKFKAAARRRRGVTAWVEREGVVRTGDAVRLFVPVQPAWPGLP